MAYNGSYPIQALYKNSISTCTQILSFYCFLSSLMITMWKGSHVGRKSITGQFSNEKPLPRYDRSLLCSADLFIFSLFLPSKSIPMTHEVFPESYASVLPRSSICLVVACVGCTFPARSIYTYMICSHS